MSRPVRRTACKPVEIRTWRRRYMRDRWGFASRPRTCDAKQKILLQNDFLISTSAWSNRTHGPLQLQVYQYMYDNTCRCRSPVTAKHTDSPQDAATCAPHSDVYRGPIPIPTRTCHIFLAHVLVPPGTHMWDAVDTRSICRCGGTTSSQTELASKQVGATCSTALLAQSVQAKSVVVSHSSRTHRYHCVPVQSGREKDVAAVFRVTRCS